MAALIEVHIDETGAIFIDNVYELTRKFPEHAERALGSALKSEGWRLQQVIKWAIRKGGPDSAKWQELNPHTGVLNARRAGLDGRYKTIKNFRMAWRGEKGKKRRVREYKPVMESARKKPFSRLAQGVRYKFDGADMSVAVGFVDANRASHLEKLLGRHAAGFETPVTPKMRRMAFALGFPLKKTTTRLRSPARPLMEPVFNEQRARIMDEMEKKFTRNINRYLRDARLGLF
jgi:hypothetical protein